MIVSMLAISTILLVSGLTSATANAELSCEAISNREATATEQKLISAKLRLANATSGPIEISAGRNVFIQVVAPETPETPFYLFLPGPNRSLFVSEAQTQNLVLTGAGVGAMNFSTQPHSISSLGKGVRPAFYSHEMKLADFAQEVEVTIANLKKLGYKNVIPVSLSYSGVLSPMLAVHDLIIETSPMTSMAAARPDLEKPLELQRMTSFWNPFFAPSINRALLDKTYRDNRAGQADTMIGQFQLPADRRQDFIEGYTSMSRAAEGSKWDNFDLSLTKAKSGADSRAADSKAMPSAGSRRVFIVGGKESPVLLKNQLQTFLELAALDPRPMLVVTGDSNQDAGTAKGVSADLIKGSDAIRAVQLMLEKLK